MSGNETIRRVASWAAAAPGRNWPPEVMEAARACLLDTLGVTLGALGEPGGRAVRRVVEGWQADGRARIALGSTTCAAGAALVNGTFATASTMTTPMSARRRIFPRPSGRRPWPWGSRPGPRAGT